MSKCEGEVSLKGPNLLARATFPVLEYWLLSELVMVTD
jgi:hypothetical protein